MVLNAFLRPPFPLGGFICGLERLLETTKTTLGTALVQARDKLVKCKRSSGLYHAMSMPTAPAFAQGTTHGNVGKHREIQQRKRGRKEPKKENVGKDREVPK